MTGSARTDRKARRPPIRRRGGRNGDGDGISSQAVGMGMVMGYHLRRVCLTHQYEHFVQPQHYEGETQ